MDPNLPNQNPTQQNSPLPVQSSTAPKMTPSGFSTAPVGSPPLVQNPIPSKKKRSLILPMLLIFIFVSIILVVLYFLRFGSNSGSKIEVKKDTMEKTVQNKQEDKVLSPLSLEKSGQDVDKLLSDFGDSLKARSIYLRIVGVVEATKSVTDGNNVTVVLDNGKNYDFFFKTGNVSFRELKTNGNFVIQDSSIFEKDAVVDLFVFYDNIHSRLSVVRAIKLSDKKDFKVIYPGAQ